MTIKDLARIAGVSHSTVSRSLNDSPLISDATKERIKKLAKEYNFDLNASARSLSTRKTGTIGIICPEVFDELHYSFYIAQLLDTIRYKLDRFFYDSIITFPNNSTSDESNIRRLLSQKKVDGLLLLIPELSKRDFDIISEYEVPHVYLHFKHAHDREKKAEYIYTDHFRGGYTAGKYFLKSGKNRFCILTEDLARTEYKERTEGFKHALTESAAGSDEPMIFTGKCSFDFGFHTVHDNIRDIKKCNGIFAHADIIAIGIIEALREHGLRVPEDIGVIGYDDIVLGKYFRPQLTTIHQPKEEIAERGTRRLFELIQMKKDTTRLQEIVAPILIERTSC